MGKIVRIFVISAIMLSALALSASAQDVYKKGYAGNVEAGAFVGNSLYASISTVHGFTKGKGFFIGLGAKFDAALMDVSGIPSFYETHDRPYSGNHYASAFLDAKLGFSKATSKVKIGADIKAGPSYDISAKALGGFCRPSLTLEFGSFGLSAGVELGAINYPATVVAEQGSQMYLNYCPYFGLSMNF